MSYIYGNRSHRSHLGACTNLGFFAVSGTTIPPIIKPGLAAADYGQLTFHPDQGMGIKLHSPIPKKAKCSWRGRRARGTGRRRNGGIGRAPIDMGRAAIFLRTAAALSRTAHRYPVGNPVGRPFSAGT